MTNDDVEAVGRQVFAQGHRSGMEHAAQARIAVEAPAGFQTPEEGYRVGNVRRRERDVICWRGLTPVLHDPEASLKAWRLIVSQDVH